ncbi:MAG: preprotein translocase subunit SecE [Candidatus Shapirobacteria bacterium]|jgi:preprotein translocase SecE subunit
MQKIINFLKEVMVIFKTITWPKKEALIQMTIVVISISIVISLILGGFDYLFTKSIGLLGNSKTTTKTTEQSITPTMNPLPTVASTSETFK